MPDVVLGRAVVIEDLREMGDCGCLGRQTVPFVVIEVMFDLKPMVHEGEVR